MATRDRPSSPAPRPGVALPRSAPACDAERRACLLRPGAWSAWAALAGCGGGGSNNPAAPPTPAAPAPESSPALRQVLVADGWAAAWSLAFLPDGRMLVTEKPGRLRTVTPQGQVSAPLDGVPAVRFEGQGGLLDVALDPAFATNRLVYLSYAEPDSADPSLSGTALARAELDLARARLVNMEVIFRMSPKVAGSAHFGGRLALPGDGTIFLTLGDRMQAGDGPQRLDTHLGKVVRVGTDGRVPADNPFVGQPAARPEIWSLGHRNVQGAAWDAERGVLWTCEHGPQGGDELNLTRAGGNHGWPLRSYGCAYGEPVGSACAIGGGTHAPAFVEPATTWVPTSIAPSGLALCTSSRIPAWQGHLFTGALAGRGLWRLGLEGEQVVFREALLREWGQRIRDVRQGPDGWLYLLTDGANGALVRLEA